MTERRGKQRGPAQRAKRGALGGLAALAAVLALSACGSSGNGPPTLSWYVFPEPSGSFDAAAKACSKASGGKYNIKINFLSTASDQQRVSLVRRLAAGDSSIDILAMDVDWTAEFATAKWIRPVPDALAAQIKSVDLPGPVRTATALNRIYAVPINSNTQLLWYRKDLLQKIGQPVPTTWDQMINDSIQLSRKDLPHYIEEQGAEYEGLTVWFNSLVNSAGGQIITPNNKVVIGHAAGLAASIMQRVATTPAADPTLNVDQEDQSRTEFEHGLAAFEINYPFVWPAAQKDVPNIYKQMGYAPYPAVVPGTSPRVSIGGYNLGVSTYSTHPDLAFQAAACLTQEQHEITYAEKGGLAPVRGAIYQIPSFRKQYPFGDLIKKQLINYGIRPQTAAYADVTLAIQKILSPTSNINARTVVSTLNGELKNALSSTALL